MTGTPGPAAVTLPLKISRRGAAAIIALERPEALNALSIGMRGAIIEAAAKFGRDPNLYVVVLRSNVAKAFSVGGDVREMTALAARDVPAARRGLADELRLCWILECLSKPTVSFINGAVMGTGAGISIYNTHRIAGEGYAFAMPETAIGYFPDCGLAYHFARMPHAIGFYLGLTGKTVGRADALALGLVTHCIASERFAEIEGLLADAEPVDPILDGLHIDPGPSELVRDGERIGRFFATSNLVETIARLNSASGADMRFAEETRALLATRSPTALQVTDRMIRNAASLDIRGALVQDYRLAHRFVELADFREGVRAFLVDKDKKPAWRPLRIEDVTADAVDAFFAPLGTEELVLESRREMQAARV